MTWAVIIVRTFVGLVFTVLAANYFLHFMPAPPMPEKDSPAANFGFLLFSSGYMHAIKVCEILGGINLLSGRYAPLGIAILLPIALNILFFDIFLAKAFGAGYVLVPLLMFVLYGYRRTVRPVFDGTARIG